MQSAASYGYCLATYIWPLTHHGLYSLPTKHLMAPGGTYGLLQFGLKLLGLI